MPLCLWWSAKRPVMYFFVSKFKLINVIILEWWGKNTTVQYTSYYLSSSTMSLLTCHSCFFPYMQSYQILCRSIYCNIMCQKIFNLTLKPFRFTLDHLKFCQSTPLHLIYEHILPHATEGDREVLSTVERHICQSSRLSYMLLAECWIPTSPESYAVRHKP